MSITKYGESPKHWEDYLVWCRINELKPTLKDYDVWLEDQDIDLDEEWEPKIYDED